MNGVFGQVEAARCSDERRDRPSRLMAKQAVDVKLRVSRESQPYGWVGNSWIGRNSIVPYVAPGQRLPASIASSRLATSSR